MPAEEASQEVNYTKIDATIIRAMERLGCDGLKKRSPHTKMLLPHVEQSLRTLPPHSAKAPPHAKNVCPHTENIRSHVAIRMRKWASCGKLHFSASISFSPVYGCFGKFWQYYCIVKTSYF